MAVNFSLSALLQAQEVTFFLFAKKLPTNQSRLNKALDQLNLKYGKNTVYLGGAYEALKDAPMRLAFNHIPDLVVENDD